MKKTMKIMALVLFVLGMTALTSCKKSTEDKLLGKWKLESVFFEYGEQMIEVSVENLLAILGEFGDDVEIPAEVYLEFKDDGHVYFENEEALYSVDGDKLTLTDGGETIVLTIKELEDKTLSLEAEEEGTTFVLKFSKA